MFIIVKEKKKSRIITVCKASDRILSDCRRVLLLRLASLGASGHFILGHVASQSTNIVLQDFVFGLQLVVVRFDCIDALSKCLQRRLKGLGLSFGGLKLANHERIGDRKSKNKDTHS